MNWFRSASTALALSLALVSPGAAQERPAGLVGSGVDPSARANSPERPIAFASAVPAGVALAIPVTAPLDVARAAPGIPADTAAAIQQVAGALAWAPEDGNQLRLSAIGGHPLVLLVGLKPASAQPSAPELNEAGGRIAQAVRDLPHPVAILAGGLPAGSGTALALGASLGQYRYDRLKSAAKAPPAQPITIVTPDAGAMAERWARDTAHLADAVRFARDLISAPANLIYPESFVDAARQAFRGLPNVSIEVLDEAQMRRLNMGGILSVSQGSRRPARLMLVRYRGGGDQAPLALVGKGVTFDTGGISIKPANGMWRMKYDMSGAARVTAAALAAARRQAPVNLVAVAALAENMPDGNATRPGDVVRTFGGQTMEIINTDAEGRVVLADANQYVARQDRPAAIVNMATLTGAAAAALGDQYAALFARDPDLGARIEAAARASGDAVWPLPLNPAYARLIRSEIADVRNSTEGVGPGASLGAHFIGHFTPEGIPWAHLDIAGVAWRTQATAIDPAGASAWGVRLLDQLIRSYERR